MSGCDHCAHRGDYDCFGDDVDVSCGGDGDGDD